MKTDGGSENPASSVGTSPPGRAGFGLAVVDRYARFVDRTSLVVGFLAIALLIVIWQCDQETADRLYQEDGIIENLAALSYLSGLFFCGYRLVRPGPKSVKTLVFWGVLCVIFLGEEISWGQRLFNYPTPALIAEINTQEEFNLHNLACLQGGSWREFFSSGKFTPKMLLSPQNLFNLGFLSYFVVFPLLIRGKPLTVLTDRLGYRPPRRTLIRVVISTVAISWILPFFSTGVHVQALAETRESLLAFFIFFYILTHLHNGFETDGTQA